MTIAPDIAGLVGEKFAGYTLDLLLDGDDDCHWFDAHADNGTNAIVYIYYDERIRDQKRASIHGFRTSSDEVTTNSTKVFISVGDHRLMMSKDLREALRSPTTRPREVAGYEIEDVLGHGFKGITFKVRQKAGPKTPYALKLTIAEEYSGKTYLPEVDLMVDLASSDRDHFPQIHRCGEFSFELSGQTHKLVYFIEDFIHGRSLEHVLANTPQSLDALFLYSFVTEMLAALATMQAHNLMHDDLHTGNVLLHEPLNGKRRPYLIDFGSTKPLGATKKQRDDIRNLASQIAAIANAIQLTSTTRTAQEERILSATEALLAVISDDDPMRRPNEAKDVYERFERAFGQGTLRQELRHPFDFGNAEEVMDNILLYSLSAKSFPWRDQIEASSHLLVIGPRGSGKTTVFRSMSFKCLCDAGKHHDAIGRAYVGLYISCNKEFRQRFSAIAPEVLIRRQADVRNYFNLVVLREFVSSLGACASVHPILESDVNALRSFIGNTTSLLRGVSPTSLMGLAGIEAVITRAVNHARMCLWADTDVGDMTEQGFIADLAELSSTSIGPFIGKSLYLFVDDYTEGKVPKDAQRALNHVLFVPNSTYKCKISSEVFGVTLDETYGNFLTQDRDYREWNLGTMYCLNLPSTEQKSFLREIVDNRLQLCGYEGRVDTVLGDSSYSQGTLARTLKEEADARREKRRRKASGPTALVDREIQNEVESEGIVAHYHGWDTICELCTGDVSNILELLNRMFDDCAVKAETTSRLTAQQQDAVIDAYSRQYIAKIKGIPKYGERLFEIVDAFGNMSKRLLQEHPWLERTPTRKDPYQLLRIELDEAGNEQADDEATKIWRLLQRYCVFIDAEESRSRRNTLSSRVILRRIFCPSFRIGLTNSESWTISRQQWEAFCNAPKQRADNFVDVIVTKKGETQSSQRRLFEV